MAGHAVPRTQEFAAAATKKVSSAASSSLVSSDFAFQRIKYLAGENGKRQGPGSWNCRRQNCGSQNRVKTGKTNKSISRKTVKEHGPVAPTS